MVCYPSAARLELLEAEKALTRRSDELARQRRELPWVRVEKDYRFATEDGDASLRDLFGGRSQMLVYHFMFDPDWDEGCPSCSAVTDGFAGSIPHFEHHDVAFVVVSRAPLGKLVAYKRRMGWDLFFAVICVDDPDKARRALGVQVISEGDFVL